VFALTIGVAEFIECVEVIAILLKRRPSEACGIDQANRGEDRDLKYLDSDSVREGRGADGIIVISGRGQEGRNISYFPTVWPGVTGQGERLWTYFRGQTYCAAGSPPPFRFALSPPPPLPYHTPSLHHTMNPPYLLITCNQHGKGLACSG